MIYKNTKSADNHHSRVLLFEVLLSDLEISFSTLLYLQPLARLTALKTHSVIIQVLFWIMKELTSGYDEEENKLFSRILKWKTVHFTFRDFLVSFPDVSFLFNHCYLLKWRFPRTEFCSRENGMGIKWISACIFRVVSWCEVSLVSSFETLLKFSSFIYYWHILRDFFVTYVWSIGFPLVDNIRELWHSWWTNSAL